MHGLHRQMVRVTHFPDRHEHSGTPIVSDDNKHLIRCWQMFDTSEMVGLAGMRIVEAWVGPECIDEEHPTCLACIGLGA